MIGNILRFLLMILLGILKFLGWTILIILLLILFLLIFISVNPFRYQLTVNLKDDLKESEGKAEVTWLWKLIKAGGIYENHEFKTYLELPFRKKKKETSLEEAEDFAENQLDKAVEQAGDIPQELAQAVTEVASEEMENLSETCSASPENDQTDEKPVFESVSSETSQTEPEDTVQNKEEPPATASETDGLTTKAEQIRAKIDDLAAKVILRFIEIHAKAVKTKETLEEKADHLSRKAEPVLVAIQDEKNQKTVKHIFHEIFSLLGKLLPKDLDLNFVYSAGSPDTTGLIYGFVYMFPEGYKREWYIEPDFETDHFFIVGEVRISGAIYIGSLFVLLFRILFAPCVWHTVFSALRVMKEEKRISQEIKNNQKG